MKFRLLLFSSMALFMLSRPAIAYREAFCPEHVTSVKIDNRVLISRLKYVHNKSMRYLSSIDDDEERDGFSLGYSPQKILDETTVNMVPDDNGCFKEITVNVIIDFLNPIIYISSELAVNSPEYKYVFWHESEHARITVENNKRYLPYLEQELRRYVSGIRIYRPTSFEEKKASEKYVYNKITDVVTKNIDKINSMNDALNKEFDAKEHKHDAWLASVVRKIENGYRF